MLDLLLAHLAAIEKESDPAGPHPPGPPDLDVDLEILANTGSEVPGGKHPVHLRIRQESHADQHLARQDVVNHLAYIDTARVIRRAANVGPAMTHRLGYGMGVAARDRRQPMARVQQGEPVGEVVKDLLFQGLAVDHLNRVQAEPLAAIAEFSRDGIETDRTPGALLEALAARMVTDHHPDSRGCPYGLEQLVPVLVLVVGGLGVLVGGEGVEVADGGGELVSHHRFVVISGSGPGGKWAVISVMVVIRGDRDLDPLPGYGHHTLSDARIAVLGIGQRVNMSVSGEVAGGVHLPLENQLNPSLFSRREIYAGHTQPVLEAPGRVDPVLARLEGQVQPAVKGVGRSLAEGEL